MAVTYRSGVMSELRHTASRDAWKSTVSYTLFSDTSDFRASDGTPPPRFVATMGAWKRGESHSQLANYWPVANVNCRPYLLPCTAVPHCE